MKYILMWRLFDILDKQKFLDNGSWEEQNNRNEGNDRNDRT